jgi:hypothetical protein
MRRATATRYVTPLREGGSLPAIFEADDSGLYVVHPGADLALIEEHLAVIPRICAGGPQSGPIGRLSPRERFHWLVAPRSTMVQVSPVHTGLCDDPSRALEDVFERMVGAETSKR